MLSSTFKIYAAETFSLNELKLLDLKTCLFLNIIRYVSLYKLSLLSKANITNNFCKGLESFQHLFLVYYKNHVSDRSTFNLLFLWLISTHFENHVLGFPFFFNFCKINKIMISVVSFSSFGKRFQNILFWWDPVPPASKSTVMANSRNYSSLWPSGYAPCISPSTTQSKSKRCSK